MTRLKDIADKVGVSVMTVSRALNSPERVKAELRDKILATSKELNYIPNHGARSLATNRTGIVQIITGLETTDQYFMILLAGISEYLSENGYAITIEKKHRINYRCDGVIIMSLNTGESTDFFKNTNVPFVLFGKTDNNLVDYVDLNNELGTQMATRHLIDLGHKKIAFMGVVPEEPFSQERLNGYLNTMSENNLPVPEDFVIISKNFFTESYEAAEILMKRCDFTAVVCSSDVQAMSLINAANNIGRKVPDDFSIVGFDGVYLHQITIPKLTTILQPVHEIGRKLSETLIKRINDPDREIEKIIFNPEFLQGESTSPCKDC